MLGATARVWALAPTLKSSTATAAGDFLAVAELPAGLGLDLPAGVAFRVAAPEPVGVRVRAHLG